MKRILCFGDSLTWGFIPGSGERYDETKRWTKLLQKKLGNHYEIIENGISGRVSSYDHGRNPYQCGRTGLGFALCESAPLDMVILMLGTNDLEFYSPESIGVGIDELVRNIQNANGIYRVPSPIFKKTPNILVIVPPFIKEEIDEISPYNSVYGKAKSMKRFPAIYKSVCDSRKIYYMDSNEFIETSIKDCIHIDDENSKKLADAIYNKIKEIEKGA